MSSCLEWLPKLVVKGESESMPQYLDRLHQLLKSDFVLNKTLYKGKRVCFKRTPEKHGKEWSFWHLITHSENKKVSENSPLRAHFVAQKNH